MTEGHADEILDDQLGAGAARASSAGVCARRAAARCVATARACEAGRRLPVARLESYVIGETLLIDEATQRHLELAHSVEGSSRGSLFGAHRHHGDGAGSSLAPPASARASRTARCHPAPSRRRGTVRDASGPCAKNCGPISPTSPTSNVWPSSSRSTEPCRAIWLHFAVRWVRSRESPTRSLAAPMRPPGKRWASKPAGPSIDPVRRWLERSSTVAFRPTRPRGRATAVSFAMASMHRSTRRVVDAGGQRMIVELEARLRDVGHFELEAATTRVFGWYVEVTRSQLNKAPPTWRRKQTIAAGERFTCDDLDVLADQLAHAEERASARESELFTAIVRDLAAYRERLRTVAGRLAEWDVASALAEVAHRDDWVRPEIDDSLDLCLEDARHPVVESLAASGCFVPNDVTLSAAEGRPRLWLVTGPNMAGKSTLMRQTAFCVILAQMGAFAPARRARIGIVDRVLTRVGASDNLSRGESTFMVEMKETANVLRRATRRSFVVLDEIGRGTSTYDGLAIAWAVAEHLHDVVGCRALFATHYHELTGLADPRPGTCENWSVSAREHAGDVVFLHKLQRGPLPEAMALSVRVSPGCPKGYLRERKPYWPSSRRAGHFRAVRRHPCVRGLATVDRNSTSSTDRCLSLRRHTPRSKPCATWTSIG